MVKISLNGVFLSLKIVFILINNADPDEMPPNVAFHLVLHCLPKDLFIDVQKEKGKSSIYTYLLGFIYLNFSLTLSSTSILGVCEQ